MEITSKFKERENQSPLNSPTSTTTTSTNGPPSIPITRSDPNSPYPTTFVTADTSSFKQVVQMLTGSPDTTKHPKQPDSKNYVIPPIRTPNNNTKKQGFKLYERRNSLKNMISPLHASFSPRHNHYNNIYNGNNNNNNNNNVQEILSPSLLDFPSLTLSPVTPLSIGSSSEEDKAIAEKGFYLHPSPRESNPQLLPLFPLSSPRMSGP